MSMSFGGQKMCFEIINEQFAETSLVNAMKFRLVTVQLVFKKCTMNFQTFKPCAMSNQNVIPKTKLISKANMFLLVLRHIEVHADENSFPGHIHWINPAVEFGRARGWSCPRTEFLTCPCGQTKFSMPRIGGHNHEQKMPSMDSMNNTEKSPAN